MAYFQRSVVRANEIRSFEMEGYQPKIRQGCEDTFANCALDTSRVNLGCPSAGGDHSLILELEHYIPDSGLLLSFPVYIRDSDNAFFIQSAERGLKLAMFYGENDWPIQQQKKNAISWIHNEYNTALSSSLRKGTVFHKTTRIILSPYTGI